MMSTFSEAKSVKKQRTFKQELKIIAGLHEASIISLLLLLLLGNQCKHLRIDLRNAGTQYIYKDAPHRGFLYQDGRDAQHQDSCGKTTPLSMRSFSDNGILH